MVGTAIYVMLLTYIYPVLSKFYNTVKRTILNAFLMSVRHFPYTLLMLAITAAPGVIMFVVPNAFAYGLLFYVLLGFSVIAYIKSIFFVKIFDKYIPEDAEEETNETSKEVDVSVFKNLQPVSEDEIEVAVLDEPANDAEDNNCETADNAEMNM